MEKHSIEFYLEDKGVTCKRMLKTHAFYTSGSHITLTKEKMRSYVVKITENVFVEEDASKGCRKYPNPEFSSYGACDDAFVKEEVSRATPGVVPVWMTDNLENVTRKAKLSPGGKIREIRQ